MPVDVDRGEVHYRPLSERISDLSARGKHTGAWLAQWAAQ
jgi:hypothetical protein